MSNKFISMPPKVALFDPIAGRVQHTWCFIGDVPAYVVNAVNSSPNGATALKYYEKKALLAPVADVATKNGGSEYVDMHLLEEMFAESDGDKLPSQKYTPDMPKTNINRSKGDITFVNDIRIYPDDNLWEIKEKFYAVSGIPAYRQHMFYFNHGRMTPSYRIVADGLYPVDIRDTKNATSRIMGAPIDKTLYDLREEARVEDHDSFTLARHINPGQQLVLYVVDLMQYTRQFKSQLSEMLGDVFQFELFYFGFVFKYWPQLTKECFYDYAQNEGDMQFRYPDLARSQQNILGSHKYEKQIVDGHYKALNAAEHEIKTSISIQQFVMTLKTHSVVNINIRNLFDYFEMSPLVHHAQAIIEVNGKRLVVNKRYVKQPPYNFPQTSQMKQGCVFAIKMPHGTSLNNKPLLLSIAQNGRYFIRGAWAEEVELDFAGCIEKVKQVVNPIIREINKHCAYAIYGGTLTEISTHNVQFQSVNVGVYWKKVISGAIFKEIKTRWEPYFRGGIIKQRNVQQFTAYEFMFCKGMYQFDHSVIDRVMSASTIQVVTNQYAHLSNPTIKQKWDQNFNGHVVRMSHRTTDIKFDIINVRDDEFVTLHNYIKTFLKSAKENVDINMEMRLSDVKKLKKLKLSDPELYNLKKHGSDKVYSILCQNQRQPFVYTEDEIYDMDKDKVKKLTKYWNFTQQKAAYYGCPNRKYPHLSFIVGEHPLHYCLPCCRKSLTTEESKKSQINAKCLADKIYMDEDGGDVGRHIMTYGKDIDPGRISRIPGVSLKPLLENVSEGYAFYMYGVEQYVPGSDRYNVGIIFAAADALGMTVRSIILHIIRELESQSSHQKFASLLAGDISFWFKSPKELASVLREMFIDVKPLSVHFERWHELCADLLFVFFNLFIVSFVDPRGDGENITMNIDPTVLSEITHESRHTTPKSVMLLFTNVQHVSPLYLVSEPNYIKSGAIQKKIFNVGDPVIRLVISMIKRTDISVNKNPDLTFMIDWSKTEWSGGFRIIKKYVNRHNMVYAVLLQRDDNFVYWPIEYSLNGGDGIPADTHAFDRPQSRTNYAGLIKVAASINEYIKTEHKITLSSSYRYALFKPDTVIKHKGEYIAVVSNGLYYFFAEGYLVDPAHTVKDVAYDYSDVNKHIIENKIERDALVKDESVVANALYESLLYKLFVMQFLHFINNERNDDMRKEIITTINKTDFGGDITAFRKHIIELLRDFPDDSVMIQSQLSEFYYDHFDKKRLVDDINKTQYGFDRFTINKIRKMSREDGVKYLTKICEEFCVVKKDFSPVKFPNIYTPCIDETTNQDAYCMKTKLVIKDAIEPLVDVLIGDLHDDIKYRMLLNVRPEGIIEFNKFRRRNNELITMNYI